MDTLTGKVAIVTGAAGGIGRGIVQRYLEEGAHVVAADIVPAALHELSSGYPGMLVQLVGDVSKWDFNVQMVASALETFGKLDVFVGNAGIYDQGVPLSELDGAMLSDSFDELMSVNVKGYLLGVRAALPSLLATRGSVILTASYASFSSSGGGILYTAAKHAVAGLVRQLAYELAPDVRVNGVAPGIAPTSLTGLRTLGQQRQNSILEGTLDILPLAEVPPAEAYGGIYALLASDRDARHITGTIVTADSGLSIRGLARPRGRAIRTAPISS